MSTTNGYAAFLRNRDMAKIIADTNMSEAEKYAYYEANYGTKAPKYTAATTPEMSYADYLKRTGMNGATQRQYDATVRTAEADYAKGKATYGQTGETLAQRGLSGSGYGDYLTGASFAAMQNAKVAAADTKALADAEIARGYGEYLTGVQQANAVAQANADNANAEAQAADAANKQGYANYINDYNLVVEDAQKTIADYMAQGYKNREIVDMMRSKYGDTFNEQLGEWIGAAQKSKKLAEEEQKAADTANIKNMIANAIGQGLEDPAIKYMVSLNYNNVSEDELSQWINEARNALGGTDKSDEANSVYRENIANVGSAETRRLMLEAGYSESEIDAALEKYSGAKLASMLESLNYNTTVDANGNAVEWSSDLVPTNAMIDDLVNAGQLTEADAMTLKASVTDKRNKLLVSEFENNVNTAEEEANFFAKIDELRASGDISTKTYKALYKRRLDANLETLLSSGEDPLVALADLDTFINSISDNVSGGLAAYLKGELTSKMDVNIDIKPDSIIEAADAAIKLSSTKDLKHLVPYTAMEITIDGKTEEIKLITTGVISQKTRDALGEGNDGDVKVHANKLYYNVKGKWTLVTIPSNFVLGNTNIGGKERAEALYELLVYKYR